MSVIETVQYRTPLAVSFHDILSDSVITDALRASARVSGVAGRFRAGYSTPSGAHVLAGLPALRELERPRLAPGRRLDDDDLPSGLGLDVDVLVEDRLGRFLPTVLLLTAPLDHVATAADVLAPSPALAWSVPDDTPMFLMSAPTRSLPPTTAVVRASIRHHLSGAEAAHAAVRVETPSGRRYVGVADGHGNVVVPFPYPAFDGPDLAASIPAGTAGTPTDQQQWPVTVSVRWQPDILEFPVGVDVPYAHTVLSQESAAILADEAGSAVASLSATVTYGAELRLATAGVTERDRASYLFVEPAL